MHCKDLLKILKDFTSIPTRFSHILQKTWAKIFTPEPLRESHNVVIEGPAAAGEDLARSWDKNLPRATQKGFHGSASKTWHLQGLHSRTSYRKDLARISTRSSDKDLYKIMLGPLREDFTRISTTRTCARSCKDSSRMSTGSSQDLLIRTCSKFMQGPLTEDLGQELHILWTSKAAPWNSCNIVIEGPSKELQHRHRRTFHRTHKISLPRSQRIC